MGKGMSDTEPLRGLVESVYSSLTDPLFSELQNAVYSDDRQALEFAIAKFCNQLTTLDMMHKSRCVDAENIRLEDEKMDAEIKSLYTDLKTGSSDLEKLKQRLLTENTLIQQIHEGFEAKERFPLSENSTVDLDLSLSLSEYDKQIELLHREEQEVDKLINEHTSTLDEFIAAAANVCEVSNSFKQLHDSKADEIIDRTSLILGSSASSRQSSKSPFPQPVTNDTETNLELEGEEIVEREVEDEMELEEELNEQREVESDQINKEQQNEENTPSNPI